MAKRRIEFVSVARSKTVPRPVAKRERRNHLVIGHERAGQFDSRCNQQPIRRIAMFEVVQRIGTTRRSNSKRRGLQTGAVEKALSPIFDRKIELDPPQIDEQPDLPDGDGTKVNRPALPPAIIDPRARRRAQAPIGAVEP